MLQIPSSTQKMPDSATECIHCGFSELQNCIGSAALPGKSFQPFYAMISVGRDFR